jgi:hypothetical protein
VSRPSALAFAFPSSLHVYHYILLSKVLSPFCTAHHLHHREWEHWGKKSRSFAIYSSNQTKSDPSVVDEFPIKNYLFAHLFK